MSPSAAELPAGFTLLVVCTANVCRSPLAERIGSAYLDEASGADAESTFRIVSAGTEAVAGREMSSDTALVLRGLGGDPDKFWAGKLSAEVAASADLTLTMTRQQRDEVLALAPRSLARTFTLLEAADLLSSISPFEAMIGAGLPERARGIVQIMATARMQRRSSLRDDIPDPVGRGVQVHQEVGEVIADAMLGVLGRLTGADLDARAPTSHAAHVEQAVPNHWRLRMSRRK